MEISLLSLGIDGNARVDSDVLIPVHLICRIDQLIACYILGACLILDEDIARLIEDRISSDRIILFSQENGFAHLIGHAFRSAHFQDDLVHT